MTKTCLLDYDSIAGADKFGNIFVLRVPADVSDDVDNPTGAALCFVVRVLKPLIPAAVIYAGTVRRQRFVGLHAVILESYSFGLSQDGDTSSVPYAGVPILGTLYPQDLRMFTAHGQRRLRQCQYSFSQSAS